MFDIKKAAEIISPYQEKIYALYDELKSELKKEFGESYNDSGKLNMSYIFYASEEDAIFSGMEFDFFDDLCGKYFKADIDGIVITSIDDSYGDLRYNPKIKKNRGSSNG